jgi:Cu+-exporting ATPase
LTLAIPCAIPWTADRIAAVVAGVAMLIFLRAFFFGRRESRTARPSTAGIAGDEVSITVAGGYDPGVVIARPGVPLTLVFDRRESNPCTDEIVIPDFGIRQALPAFAETRVRIVPTTEGEFPFSCGMNMLHGTIRVETTARA